MSNFDNCDTVIIWDAELYGRPENFDQAMDMALCLAQQDEMQISDKLLAFAQLVEPQLTEVLEGEDLYPFSEMSRAVKDSKYAAFSLVMPEYNWQLALSVLVAAANQLGLVVFYQEACMAFVAPNKVLPPQAENTWQATKDFLATNRFPTSIKQFKSWFAPSLDKMFSEHGFVIGDVDEIDTSISNWTIIYTKKVPIGIQNITVYCGRVRNGFDVSFLGSMKVDYLSHIYNKFDFDKARLVYRYVDGTLENKIFNGQFPNHVLHMDPNDTVVCNQISALRLINIINSKLMPIYKSASMLKGLDEALNSDKYPYFREHVHSHYLKPYCLIVARLAKSPSFEQLAIELPKIMHGNSEIMLLCWPAFVKYLREEINPDTFFKEFASIKLEEQRLEAARVKAIQDHFNPKTDEELMALAAQWQDPNTGLIWQRCCVGQHWEDGKVVGTAKLMKWKDAKLVTKKVKGFDWRIPTGDELKMMMLPNQPPKDIETVGVFGARDVRLQNGRFWAWLSSPYENYEAYTQRFENGIYKSGTYEASGVEACVLLVRSPD